MLLGSKRVTIFIYSSFIVENIILTFLGCLIGIIVSFTILQIVNNSDLISNIHLTINLTVHLWVMDSRAGASPLDPKCGLYSVERLAYMPLVCRDGFFTHEA